jgi:hypothetical protein
MRYPLCSALYHREPLGLKIGSWASPPPTRKDELSRAYQKRFFLSEKEAVAKYVKIYGKRKVWIWLS